MAEEIKTLEEMSVEELRSWLLFILTEATGYADSLMAFDELARRFALVTQERDDLRKVCMKHYDENNYLVLDDTYEECSCPICELVRTLKTESARDLTQESESLRKKLDEAYERAAQIANEFDFGLDSQSGLVEAIRSLKRN